MYDTCSENEESHKKKQDVLCLHSVLLVHGTVDGDGQ